MRNGITVAGYIGVDVLKEIDGFPGPHDLVNIHSVDTALGGLVSNCARDLALLDCQYSVEAVQPVDMFPHTHHVENVVKLKRRETSTDSI